MLPGFDSFDAFGVEADIPKTPLSELEGCLGPSQQCPIGDILKDPTLVDNLFVWPAKKAWYVNANKATSEAEARRFGSKVLKGIKSRRDLAVSAWSVHPWYLYVGWGENHWTRLDPVQKNPDKFYYGSLPEGV